MLQDQRRLIRLAIFVLATPVALFAQDSQHDGRAEAHELAITGATLIDGTGGAPRPATTILVRDGRIAAVTPDADAEVPAGATEIDAAGKYVIPGLADLHVHLSLGLPLPRREDETDIVLARKLYYGVTTILAIGASDASPESIHSHRARRAAGELLAPYIYGTGGHLTLQGTHPIDTIFPPPIRQKADELAAETPESEPVDLYPLGIGLSIVRTEEAARKAVRERAEAGMDAIKITVESGPTPFGDDHPQMSVEMIRAIVDEAAKHDLGVFAHITSLDELQATLEGGAAGVVHTVWDRPFPDAELADRMAARSFHVIPTTSVYRGTASLYYIDDPIDLDDPFLRETVSDEEVAILRNPEFIARFRSRWQRPLAADEDREKAIRLQVDELLANVGMLHQRGVPIVLGTDTGTVFSFAGYSVHDELEHLVEAGLTPGQALEAATRRAAEMLDREDEFGTIEPGKRADLLILGANPLEDIRNTRSLETVIAEGHVVDRDTLPIRFPQPGHAADGATPGAAQNHLAITPVTVIDVTDGSVRSNQTVLVGSNRITAVGPVDEVTVPEQAEVVDGAGGYLIPGLWDMHVHSVANVAVDMSIESVAAWEWHFPLFLAHGVTGVRNMNDGAGDLTLELANWVKRRMSEGELAGPPRFLNSGPSLDGDPPLASDAVVVRTADTQAAVAQLASNGADLVKVYENLSREAYFAIMEAAQRKGLPVDGHVPFRVTPEEAADAGQRTVEHPEALAAGCSTQAETARETFDRVLSEYDSLPDDEKFLAQFRYLGALYDNWDPAACTSAIEAYKQSGVALAADLIAYHHVVHAEQVLSDTAGMRLVPGPIRRNWEESLDSETIRKLRSILRPIVPLQREQVGLFHEAGGTVLVATDVGIPFQIPGISLHEELGLLVEAGLTPLEALRAATLDPARVLGMTDSLGTVEPGKLADLILLDANPLDDIRNTQRIRAVVADGRLFRRADLDQLLATVEALGRQSSNESGE